MRMFWGALGMAVLVMAVFNGQAHAGRTSKAKEMYQRGMAYENKGDYRQAVYWYSEAIKLKPESAAYYFVRGRAYRNLSRLEESIKDLSRAISLKPGYDDAYNNRGMAYVGKGRSKDAESDFRKACGHGLNDGCLNLKKLLEEKK